MVVGLRLFLNDSRSVKGFMKPLRDIVFCSENEWECQITYLLGFFLRLGAGLIALRFCSYCMLCLLPAKLCL